MCTMNYFGNCSILKQIFVYILKNPKKKINKFPVSEKVTNTNIWYMYYKITEWLSRIQCLMEECKKVTRFEKRELGLIWSLNLAGLIVIFKPVSLRLCGSVYWPRGRAMIRVSLVSRLASLMSRMRISDTVTSSNENRMWGAFDTWIVMSLNILLIVEVRY